MGRGPDVHAVGVEQEISAGVGHAGAAVIHLPHGVVGEDRRGVGHKIETSPVTEIPFGSLVLCENRLVKTNKDQE